MVKRITVTVTDEFHYEIKLQAAKEGISISDKLRAMLKRWVETKGQDEGQNGQPTGGFVAVNCDPHIVEAIQTRLEETRRRQDEEQDGRHK